MHVDAQALGRQIFDMPDRGLHDEVLAEIFIDRFRLGGRFDDYEILCHYGFTPATHRCSFGDQRLLAGLFVNANASGLENSTNYTSKAKQPIFPAKLLALSRDSIPAAHMMVARLMASLRFTACAQNTFPAARGSAPAFPESAARSSAD